MATDGVIDSAPATVTITVDSVNDAPVAADDAFSVNEDGTLSGSGLLANASDLDGDSLSASLVTTTAHGALALATD